MSKPGDEFAKTLRAFGRWFERQKRVLPWRDDPSLYRVWISEIMLQQTQVVTVVPYFERFTARFPTVESLAKSPVEEVLLHWAGLGYYSRARNLHQAAQKIVAQGGFPKDLDGWLEIPGVGPYTAGAILSIALDRPVPILDGNVERVLSRVRRVTRKRGDAPYKERLWRLSRIFVEMAARARVKPSMLNQAMMELGATICTPRNPKCPLCPLSGICRAQAAGEQESYPRKKKPKKWLSVQEELHCLIDAKGRVLLRQRETGEWRSGLWDLIDEKPRAGAARRVGSVETRHIVTRHKISRVTHVWTTARLQAAEAGESMRWITPDASDVAVGSALKRTLRTIREKFPEAWPRN